MRTAILLVLLAANPGFADETHNTNHALPSRGIDDIRDLRRAERRMTYLLFASRMNMTATMAESEKSLSHFKLSRIDGANGHLVKLVSPSVGGYTEIIATKLVLGCDGEKQVIATADATHVIVQLDNIKMRLTEVEFDLETSKLRLTGENVSNRRYVVPDEHSESSESLPPVTESSPNGE